MVTLIRTLKRIITSPPSKNKPNESSKTKRISTPTNNNKQQNESSKTQAAPIVHRHRPQPQNIFSDFVYHNPEDSICGNENKTKKFKKVDADSDDAFAVDLTGVPPQSPIPKSEGRIKDGASKYTGVSFNKAMNKWQAKIHIDGKARFIGSYEKDDKAAVDYARAVYKYKKQGTLGNAREQNLIIDLSDVPPQPPLPKIKGRIKDGASASKYTGVSFHRQQNKWHAQIMIEGKTRHVGLYENEEEAAVDYARAVVKYKGQGVLDNAREERARDKSGSVERNSFIIDLRDVPPQPPIPKRGRIKDGASKYTGVSFNKAMNKWQAKIFIDGKARFIGSYENEDEAAVDYARAVYKYRGEFGTEG